MLAERLERLAYRVFCGSECWEVEYILYFADGGFCGGIHRTYRALSRCTAENRKVIGLDLAKEISSEFRLKTGIAAEGCKIFAIQRIW